MLKIIARWESVVDGKTGHFLMDHDTPITAAKEMAFQFLKYLGQIEDAAKTKAQENVESPINDEAKAPAEVKE